MERVVLGASFAFLLAVVALTANVAEAQCAEGRVANEQTQGRCCWPGQAWNPETALCSGAPGCPAGRVAQGEDCVLQSGVGAAPGATAVQTQPQAQPADPNAVPAAPGAYGGQPQQQAGTQYQAVPMQPVAPVETRTEMHVNKGLLIPGIIMFSVSYGIAIGVSLIECTDCGWFLVPVAGPLIFMGNQVDSGDPAAAYVGLIAWGLVQAAGITMAILGLVMKREVQVRADLGEGRSIALQPFDTPGGGGGLQLLGEF